MLLHIGGAHSEFVSKVYVAHEDVLPLAQEVIRNILDCYTHDFNDFLHELEKNCD
jgi:hypothetical protein